ncbi:MAG: Stp1/IreP family PP2C-type Ser/Thr phosphatase [Phormidesmis sp. RL_2_1]|nr:Stp1/IreP family PP2C-type Ser/Thr phosphatase [Phormidesmis sp. RL_2_1]
MSHVLTEVSFAGLTDVGLYRNANQDSYYLSPTGDLFIVADGMGGHTGGQEASRLATEIIQTYLQDHTDSDCTSSNLLEQAILAANQAILNDQKHHPERADMGTTVVVVMVRDGDFWCAHVGDSRLYLLRESGFMQMTQDHTWVSQALKEGELSLEQLQHHPWRHILSQCVGREDLSKIETQRLTIESGDRLLLCSDGLTEELSDDAIITCLQAASTCEGAAIALVDAAKSQGGRDNITAVVLAVP